MWDVFVGEDRTGLNVPTAPEPGLRFVAWVAVASLFIIGWGASTVPAVRIALGGDYTPVAVTDLRAVTEIVVAVGIAGAAWALIRVMRAVAGSATSRPSLLVHVKVFPVAMAAAAVGFMSLQGLSWLFGFMVREYPRVDHDTPSGYVLDMVSSMMAGPTEELALMALVVTALRTTGYSWTVVCITAIAVRVPFHLYYGWGAVGLGLWAVLIVALYRRTNALLAIILAHAAFNGLNFAGQPGLVIKCALIVVGLLIAAWTYHRRLPGKDVGPVHHDR